MTPEGKVKANVKAILKQRGAYFFSPMTHGYGRSGVPDIVGCYRGRFFAIECKAGRNTPTMQQSMEITQIRECCGLALVVNEGNLGDVELMLNAIDVVFTREPQSA